MSNSASSDIKFPLKQPWKVGTNCIVVIDKSLVEKLGIDEGIVFQEELLDDGIFLRIIKPKMNLGSPSDARQNDRDDGLSSQ